jgi:hypothetical protein
MENQAMNDSNRRRSHRIDDRVSLLLRVVQPQEATEILESFETRRNDFSLTNHFMHQEEQLLPQMRMIEKRMPEVAKYLKFLEEQIQTISRYLISHNQKLSSKPDTKVNLSADGLRLYHNAGLVPGTVVELAMMVFPSRSAMLAYAEVVRSEIDKRAIDKERPWNIALTFTHLHEEDKEMLYKHIHQRQLSALRDERN